MLEFITGWEPEKGYVIYASIDLETTGFAPYDQIAEIGVVLLDEHFQPDGEWSTLVRPFTRMHNGAFMANGLAPEDLKQAPRFRDVVTGLTDRIEGRVLLGHSIDFDVRMLTWEYYRLDAAFVSAVLDSRTYWPGSLNDACRQAGIERGFRVLSGPARMLREQIMSDGLVKNVAKWRNTRPHSALADARAVASLFGVAFVEGYVDNRSVPAGRCFVRMPPPKKKDLL